MFKTLFSVVVMSFLIVSCSKDKEDTPDDNSVSIKTLEVQVINYKSIKSGGVIESSGSKVIQRGVCYSDQPQPTIAHQITKDGDGLGSFNSHVSQLKPNTQYHLRAYMVNEKGTFYGNELTFKTLDYPTENVWKMGDQVFVINNQSLLGAFTWDMKKFFYATDDVAAEINAITMNFTSKPNITSEYHLVKKNKDELLSDECNLVIISSRSPYVGQYSYLSSGSHKIQVQVVAGKTKIIIPPTHIYQIGDSTLSYPIPFSANLIEK